MKKKTIFYYLTSIVMCLILHITIVKAQPSCSQWDWCRHNVEIKNTSCCTVEIWCQELGCDGRDYFMGNLEPGKSFNGRPDAYGAKFKVAFDGYYQHEFPSLDINGYCNDYNFEYKGSNNVCSKPSINTSGDQTICKGQSVEICASGADNYWWSNGKDKRCITVSPHQTKTYTVSGSKNGCEASSHVTVHVNDSFNLHTDDDKTICAGKSVEICANGADGYWWSTGDEKRCITVNPHETTTYQVVGGKNGCEATGHVKVIVNDKFSMPSSDDQTICKGQSVEICGSNADHYQWNTGDRSACITVNPHQTTTYTLVGNKNGCKDNDPITVHVNDSFNLHTDDDKTICAGQSVKICASGADSYWWSNGKEKRCITVSPHQTKTYQAYGSKNGCEGSGHVTVNVNDSFNLHTDDDKTICAGQSVEICASGADGYWWSNGKEKRCITVSPNHTKTFAVTGIKDGCEGSGEVTVNVNDSFSLNTDDDKTICAGQSVEICASGADSYWWSNGKEKRCITVSPHQTKTYQAYGSKNGCEGSGHVTVNVNDSFNLQTSDDQTIHPGESVEICASGANGYWWSNGKESACIHVSPHQTTTYSVEGIKDGCEGYGEVKVIVNQNNICSIDDIKLHEGSISKYTATLGWTDYSNAWYSLYLRESGDKNWNKFEIDYSGVQLNNLWPCTTYDWAISVKCSNGIVSDICDIRSFTTSGHCGDRLPSQGAIEISQSLEETFDNISVLPNPATNLVVINYKDIPVRQIAIYNNLGKLIENVEADATGRVIVELENYSSGVYVIIANAADKLYKNLFVVK